MNLAILWRLELEAWALVRGSLRLGACSFWPLITIRGPKRSHPLLMILSSAAMVWSCGPEACLTSIVNCFIFFLFSVVFDIIETVQILPATLNVARRQIFIRRGKIS